MKNQSKKMYVKLSTLLLSAVLMMTGLSTVAAETPKNLIDAFDPTFESYAEGQLTAADTLFTLYNASVDTVGADASTRALKLTEPGSAIRFVAPVEPAKNYNFTFWMRNSKEKALQLQGGSNLSGFMLQNYKNPVDNKTYSWWQICDGGLTDWDWKQNPYNAYLGVDPTGQGKNINYYNADEYTFGINRSESEADKWRQVTINFSTPAFGVSHVRLYLACVAADEKLAIDNLSLGETDKNPNFVFNGYFDAIRNDKEAPDVSGVSYNLQDGTSTATVTVESDPETQNTYLKVDSTVNTNPDTGKPFRMTWQVFSKTAAFMQGKKAGTRYKLSYKAKAEDKPGFEKPGTKWTSIYFTGKDSKDYEEFQMGQYTDEWKTYTMYFDATNFAKEAKNFSGYTTQFGYYTDSEYTLYLDDLYSWYDESNIGFYKTLDFNYEDGAADRYWDFKNIYVEHKDVIMTESSVEAASLASLTPDAEGNRTVKVRAHFLPEAIWGTDAFVATTADFAKTEVRLLAGVYKYEKIPGERIESKSLVGLYTADATSEKGETIDAVCEVSVPENSKDVRYVVEAMAWNKDSMRPIMGKAILE